MEKRTTNAAGQAVIPVMDFKQCVDLAAQQLGKKAPGLRGATSPNTWHSVAEHIVDDDITITAQTFERTLTATRDTL